MFIDLGFVLNSDGQIPVDHGYLLYGALSATLPYIHNDAAIGVHPICGQQVGHRLLRLTARSTIAFRLNHEQVIDLMPLVGKQIVLAGTRIHIGAPSVSSLVAAPSLRSRLVTIKGYTDPGPFRDAVLRKIHEMGLGPMVEIALGRRRTIRIRDKEVIGFEVIVMALDAEESIKVQERGLGGRRHMGCGVFQANRCCAT
jgi:CRISPR-associated protein Cas6